jgi:hypothetical protein
MLDVAEACIEVTCNGCGRVAEVPIWIDREKLVCSRCGTKNPTARLRTAASDERPIAW